MGAGAQLREDKRQGEAMAQSGKILAGKYEIIRLIGEGGMSRVYLAMDKKLNKQWAVKEIKPTKDPKKQEIVRQSLVTETNMIKQLDHPALPRITDLVNEEGILYVIMDYIEGEPLSRILDEQGAQSQNDVISWGEQLCDVLDYLHTQNPPIIYRDMKPSNIMLKPDGTVKLIDFGIAREYREQNEGEDKSRLDDTTILGTRGYAAPEQFGGLGQTGAYTDVYCLGATLYHLLTAKSPAEPPYTLYPIRQIDASFSPGLEKIITKATQQNPQSRYDSCAEMLYELEHYDTADDAHRKKLKKTWRSFLCVATAAGLFVLVGISGLGMSELSKSSDYDAQIELAQRSTNQSEASEYYLNAIAVKPGELAAYQGLIDLYKNDASFSIQEEAQLQQAIMPHLGELKQNKEGYAGLSFGIGKLYWYYYDYALDAGDNRLTRIMAASRWMNDAASEPSFDKQALAEVYAGIAEFNTSIVARINEGDDAGLYEPYFHALQELTARAAEEGNEVVMLETSALTGDALAVYARKFRADGIGKQEMESLYDEALAQVRVVEPTTEKLDGTKAALIAAESEIKQAIHHAFLDARTLL